MSNGSIIYINIMKIQTYKSGKWWKYWKPVWLNSITWKDNDIKLYRWLWWSFVI